MKEVNCKKVKPQKIEKKTAKILWVLMYVSLAVTLIAEFFIPSGKGHFKIEEFPFFNAIFGFLSCLAIILVSKFLGFFFKRPEDYYGK